MNVACSPPSTVTSMAVPPTCTVCATESWFLTVTTTPGLTVSRANANPEMVIDAPTVEVAELLGRGVGDAGGETPVADALDEGVGRSDRDAPTPTNEDGPTPEDEDTVAETDGLARGDEDRGDADGTGTTGAEGATTAEGTRAAAAGVGGVPVDGTVEQPARAVSAAAAIEHVVTGRPWVISSQRASGRLGSPRRGP